MPTIGKGAWRDRLLTLSATLVLALSTGGCTSLCRWCALEVPSEGVTLTDGSGRTVEAIAPFDNLRVGVTGLEPRTRYSLRAVDALTGRQMAYAHLTTDREGTLAPLTLLFAENLYPCWELRQDVPLAAFQETATEARSVERALDRVEAVERLLDGRRYLLEVVQEGRTVRRAPFTIRDLGEPRITVVNRAGCLRGGFLRGADDVFVLGRNLPPGSRVRLFTVPDQSTWNEGDPLQDLSGPLGQAEVEVVTLGQDQSDFVARVWPRQHTTTGLYDVIAQLGGSTGPPVFQRADLAASFHGVGLVIQEDASDPHLEQNMTVPVSGTVVHYLRRQDKYFNDEDVWVAINPTLRPGGISGDPQNARIYVVDHLLESGWSHGMALTDVSSDGYEEVPIQGWCRNQNEVRIWPAPLINGDYDVVVDFEPFGVYDQGQDFVDELDNVGFQVVDPSDFALVYPVNPLKIFPERETPTGVRKDALYGVVKTLPGTAVYWDSFDIDDPSIDGAPVDPNGASGDDNRGNYGAAPGGPDGDDGSLDGEDGSGVATTISNASGFAFVRFHVTSQPGDNFRLRASDSADFADFDESAEITVWRRLHVEIDSMGAPSGTTVTGTITAVSFDSSTNRSEVTVSEVLDAGAAGSTGGRFENGRLTAGASTFDVLANTASVVTAVGNVPDGVAFILEDDDVVPADVENPDTGDMVRAYAEAFILPVFDTGLDTPDVAFDLNTENTEINGQINLGKATPMSTPDYWTVTVHGGFQRLLSDDNDPDDEGTPRARAVDSVQGVFTGNESIRDWIETSTAKGGANGVDPDTTGELPRSSRRQEILNHEVGHLLSLTHPDGSVTVDDPFGGVMTPSCCPANTRQSSNFTQQSLHKLRSIEEPDS